MLARPRSSSLGQSPARATFTPRFSNGKRSSRRPAWASHRMARLVKPDQRRETHLSLLVDGDDEATISWAAPWKQSCRRETKARVIIDELRFRKTETPWRHLYSRFRSRLVFRVGRASSSVQQSQRTSTDRQCKWMKEFHAQVLDRRLGQGSGARESVRQPHQRWNNVVSHTSHAVIA